MLKTFKEEKMRASDSVACCMAAHTARRDELDGLHSPILPA